MFLKIKFSIILMFRKLKQEDSKCEIFLGYMMRLISKEKENESKKKLKSR